MLSIALVLLRRPSLNTTIATIEVYTFIVTGQSEQQRAVHPILVKSVVHCTRQLLESLAKSRGTVFWHTVHPCCWVPASLLASLGYIIITMFWLTAGVRMRQAKKVKCEFTKSFLETRWIYRGRTWQRQAELRTVRILYILHILDILYILYIV